MVDPLKLRVTDEDWFNSEIFPEIEQLQFYSTTRQAWFPIPYNNIHNNCFARRMLVDLFLWGETSLKADPEYRDKDVRYLTQFLKAQDFLHFSWIETARIVVIGKLRAGSVHWSNHEAVIINTDHGLRAIDPSFANNSLPLENWFLNFAPEEFGRKCVQVDWQGFRQIGAETVKSALGNPWNPEIPMCGFLFMQRLDTGSVAGTNGTWGTELEKRLTRDLWSYMEDRLLPRQ